MARQIGACQPIKQPFPTGSLGRGGTPFPVSPFCPPIPRFICLGQLLAFRQDWLVCAVRQQLPQITAAGLKNGPLKQRRLTESASLYLPRSESNPSHGPLVGSHLQLEEPSCTVASARRPEAVAVDIHRRQRQPKILGRTGTRDKIGGSLRKR